MKGKGEVWTLEDVEEHFKEREEAKDKLISFHITNDFRERMSLLARTRARDERGRFK